MAREPVDQLQARSGFEKRDDETVREYVERVGDECGVETAVLEGALTYITEWHYSESPSTDDTDFRELVRRAAATGDGQLPESETQSPPSNQQAESSGGPSGAQVHSSNSAVDSETGGGFDRSGMPDWTDDPFRTPAGTLGFKSGLRGSEPRKLMVRFVAICLVSPVIGWMFTRSWVPGTPLYDWAFAFLAELFTLPGAQAVDIVAVFAGGLYLGLLFLFTVDVRKRVQAMLLWVGTAVSVAVIAAAGVFFPALRLTPVVGVSFVLGMVAGVLLDADQLRSIDVAESTVRRPTLTTGEVVEFRNASTVMFGLLAVTVLVTVVHLAVAGRIHVVDVVASGIGVVMLSQFVQYESEGEYVTLGPARSGKSMLILGLCLSLLDSAETHPNPNDHLQDGIERASNLQPGRERWPLPSTAHDEVRTASFEVIAGTYFPRRLELTALDYAGQHLGRIADTLADGTGDDEGIPGHVATRIEAADTLFFVLDVERLVFPDAFHEPGVTDAANVSWGLEHYSTILDNVDPDDVLVVATKCDILIDQGLVRPPSEYDSFTTFQAAVTDHLSSRPDVGELLQTADESVVHPVYYATRRRDESYVPRLDEDGTLIPIGFDHLIAEIRARQ